MTATLPAARIAALPQPPVPGEPRCNIYDLPVSGCAHCKAKPANRRSRGPMSPETCAKLSAAQRAGGRDKAREASAQLAAARAASLSAAAPSLAEDPLANARRRLPRPYRVVTWDRQVWVPAERPLVEVHRIGVHGRMTRCGLRIAFGPADAMVHLGVWIPPERAVELVAQACRGCYFSPVYEPEEG